MLQIDFVSLFPQMVVSAAGYSILGRAQNAGLLKFTTVDPRDFAEDRHRTVDDQPYGGGSGMVLKVDVMAKALASMAIDSGTPVVLTDPNGSLFRQHDAVELSKHDRLVLLCGHYEGIDDRVRQCFATHCFSIGDFVLTGGELPALVIADAIARLVPGVLGDQESLTQDAHHDGLLSYPQFTRPPDIGGLGVPEVLLSGNHARIAKWRRSEALRQTRSNRPDLFCKASLSKSDLDLL